MKRLILILWVLILFSGCAGVQADEKLDSVVGFYAVAGVNPDGSTYAFEAVVETSDSGLTTVAYVNNGEFVAGCGLLRQGNKIAVGCVPPSVMMMTVKGKDRIEGEWRAPNAPGVGTEVWTRIPALSPVDPARLEHSHPRPTPGIRL